MVQEPLLNVKEVGAYIKLSPSCIDQLLAAGNFCQPDFLVSNHRKRLWKLSTLNNYLEQHCRNPKAVTATKGITECN